MSTWSRSTPEKPCKLSVLFELFAVGMNKPNKVLDFESITVLDKFMPCELLLPFGFSNSTK